MIPYGEEEGENTRDIIGAQLNRETPLGEYLGAKMSQAWDWTTLKQLSDYEPGYGPPMSREEWEASPYYRPEIPYDEDMNEVRARIYSERFDERRYRDSLVERSDSGFRSILGFGAQLLATSPDPINYVPFLGAGARATAIGKLGVIGGRVATGAAEAAIGTAVTDAIVSQGLIAQGEDVGWQDAALDVVFGAGVGGLFGLAGGLMTRPRGETSKWLRSLLPIQEKERAGRAIEKSLADMANGDVVDVGKLFDDVEVPPDKAMDFSVEKTIDTELPEVAETSGTGEIEIPEEIRLLPEEETAMLEAETNGTLSEGERELLQESKLMDESSGKYHEALLAAAACGDV